MGGALLLGNGAARRHPIGEHHTKIPHLGQKFIGAGQLAAVYGQQIEGVLGVAASLQSLLDNPCNCVAVEAYFPFSSAMSRLPRYSVSSPSAR